MNTEQKPDMRRKENQGIYRPPTIGDIVHVVADDQLAFKLNCALGEHLAAICTRTWDGTQLINATIFSPNQNPAVQRPEISYSALQEAGTWHRQRAETPQP